ncbi:hypothetical protein P175DRAFT_0527139 [Aspergillus ochraceoroseus IBT 24754]|uniref:Uncharacterized protein n=1 Tax=Aspergillus ochraceoroseus IBT 24754 TaxID=1392256 RepID=A0A2T5M582_9EURO|nr:uncharacterized protein P175DRAFT_0527139 [Aspergillus ochraceoroseus IBT 24754]PTU23697.1 hypothetical protein P175DRAFT_0527139 [Aspergillus ochraceoroseus IBT 24754]
MALHLLIATYEKGVRLHRDLFSLTRPDQEQVVVFIAIGIAGWLDTRQASTNAANPRLSRQLASQSADIAGKQPRKQEASHALGQV